MPTRRDLLKSAFFLPTALTADAQDAPKPLPPDPDTPFADFESGTWEGWTVVGSAFSSPPATDTFFAGRIHGFDGKRFVCTLHPQKGNLATGKAISREFTIEKPLIVFKIGGGHHPSQACLNLIVDGSVMRSATGNGSPNLFEVAWDVSPFLNKRARLEILDNSTSNDRGYLMVDHIRFVNRLPYRLSRKVGERWRVRQVTTHEPFQGTVVFPVPPDDPGQTILASQMYLQYLDRDSEKQQASVVKDLFPLRQPVYCIVPDEKRRFRVTVEIEVAFYECTLQRDNTAPEPVRLEAIARAEALRDGWLSEKERSWYRDWMTKESLLRQTGEGDMEFAYRVLGYLQKNFTYKIPDNVPEYKEAVRKEGDFGSWKYRIETKSGECWRLSDIYARILRMHGIPVRILSGNHVGSGQGHHLRTLVWLEAVGWIPVEPTAATGNHNPTPAQNFGNWGGTMLSGNQNIGFSVPANGSRFNIGTFDCLWFVPAKGNPEPYLTFTSERLS